VFDHLCQKQIAPVVMVNLHDWLHNEIWLKRFVGRYGLRWVIA